MSNKTANAIRDTPPVSLYGSKDTTAGKWRGVAGGLDAGGYFRILCTTPPLYDTRDDAKSAIIEILNDSKGNGHALSA